MIELEGKYDSAIIYNDYVEQEAITQIYTLLNHPASDEAHTRIMPDVHAGKGCVIGYTAKITDKIIPNVVGVDLGCGVSGVKLLAPIEDLSAFDEKANKYIPTGMRTYADGSYERVGNWKKRVEELARELGYRREFFEDVKDICERTGQDYDRVIYSLGTLGGGNHFCEIGKDSEGNHWFFVHSGSRNFGLRVATHWQEIAHKNSNNREEEIARIKATYSGQLIQDMIKALPKFPKDLAYLEGQDLKGYIKDADTAKKYAELNRYIIVRRLFSDNEYDIWVESTHNYVDKDDNIIRKGAISAYEDEYVLIPLNMRDGMIYGIGKGNKEWNYSAPHGAGRKMSRSEAKRTLSMEEFVEQMKGIESSCVVPSTLDESPMAYKDSEEIKKYLEDTVDIIEQIKPVWNFKAK